MQSCENIAWPCVVELSLFLSVKYMQINRKQRSVNEMHVCLFSRTTLYRLKQKQSGYFIENKLMYFHARATDSFPPIRTTSNRSLLCDLENGPRDLSVSRL